VVSSRRVSVLLVALVVVVMALGIMSVLRAVSASPDNKVPNNDDQGRTLTVLTKTREAEVVDLGPPGPTHGDIRVANAPLYDAKGTNKIGRFDLFCVVTDPADESAEKYHMSECTYTFTLPGGEISVQGLNAFPKLAGLPPEGVDAISGGTGKHAGVEGELRHQTRANKVISTFHFID
jgi:hypothetical protein